MEPDAGVVRVDLQEAAAEGGVGLNGFVHTMEGVVTPSETNLENSVVPEGNAAAMDIGGQGNVPQDPGSAGGAIVPDQNAPHAEKSSGVKRAGTGGKTIICAHFKKRGTCRFGDTCKFAHSEGELEGPAFKKGTGQRTGGKSEDIDPAAKRDAELAAQYGRLNKCVINLPKHWLSAEFKTFVDSLEIKYQSLKKQKGASVGFLSFDDVADADVAAANLTKQTIRGSQVKVDVARPRAWELRAMAQPGGVIPGLNVPPATDEHDKMKEEGADGGAGTCEGQPNEGSGDANGGSASANGGSSYGNGVAGYDDDIRKDIRDAVTPWWRTPYDKQLEQKEAAIGQLLKRLVRKARKAWPRGIPSPTWLRYSKKTSGMACPLLGIVASPITEGYRNKCEFTIGLGMDGQRTVGFQLGLYKEGYTAIASPEDCMNVSPVSKAYVEVIQDFIRTSELSVWDKKENKGVWRMVTIREGRAGTPGATDIQLKIQEVLVMVQVSANCAPSAKALQTEYRRLREMVVAGAAARLLPLTYLVVQVHEGVSNSAPPDSLQIVLVNRQSGFCERPSGAGTGTGTGIANKDESGSRNGNGNRVGSGSGTESGTRNGDESGNGHGSGTGNGTGSDTVDGSGAGTVDVNGKGNETGTGNEAGTGSKIGEPSYGALRTSVEDAAHIYENMCGLQFRLSLSAFFQVNTPAAEKLYRLAGEWARLDSRTLLFDVCCGTGTIGLTLASMVGKVVGIEMIAPAVEDAKKNAQLNGITNCEFVCGRAEAVLGRLLSKYASRVAPANDVTDEGDVAARTVLAGCDAAADDVIKGGEVAARTGEVEDDVADGGDAGAVTPDGDVADDGDVTGVDDVAGEADVAEDQGVPMGDLRAQAEAAPETDGLTDADVSMPDVTDNFADVATTADVTKTADVGGAADGANGGSSEVEMGAGNGVNAPAGDSDVAQFSDVVAIVDPPRCGLHPTVLKALAAHERLRRLVYVSCNPETLLTNVLELCVSSGGANHGRGKGGGRAPPPFRPVKAMAVDLFPHTPHCEMVMLLER